MASGYEYGTYQSVSGYGFKFRSWFHYSTSETDTTFSITLYAGAQLTDNTGTVKMSLNCSLAGTGQDTRSTTKTFSTEEDDSSKRMTLLASKKWTWQKGHSAATKTITAKVSRSGMSTSTAKATFTVPALAKKTVSYNANGGSGSISSQTKYYGEALTLSQGGAFTRENHTLIGWNTAAGGGGTSYALGGTYKDDSANRTLYAQWRMDYTKPVMSEVKAFRVTAEDPTTKVDEGTLIRIEFTYKGGTIDAGSNYIVPTCVVTIDGTEKYNAALSTATGTFGQTFSIEGGYDPKTTHTVTVKLYDSNLTSGTSATIQISTATYPIDLIGNGDDVYMGLMTPAEIGIPLKTGPLNIGGNLTVNGSLLNDWIISRGKNGDWYYEKWASGKVEAYFYGQLTGSTPTQTNTYYYRSSDNSFTIPSGIFPATPICVGTNINSSNTVMFGFSIKMTSATAGTWQIFRTNNNAVSFHAGAHFVYTP